MNFKKNNMWDQISLGGYFMRLNKLAVGVTITSFLGIGTFLNPKQANAAAWHRGVPVALEGNYARKQSTYPQFETLQFSANKVIYQGQGNPQLIMRHIGYQKIGNRYSLRGIVKANTTASGAHSGKETWKFYRFSHKIASKSFDGKSNWYYKNLKV